MRYASSGSRVTLETLTDGQMSGKSGRKTEKRSHQHGHGGSGASGGMDAWAEMERASLTFTTPRRRGFRCRRRPNRDDPGRAR